MESLLQESRAESVRLLSPNSLRAISRDLEIGADSAWRKLVVAK
jgi:hypothetical protein